MGTKPFAPEPEETLEERVAGRISDARDIIIPKVREALTGDQHGRARRAVLFVIAGACMGAAGGLFAAVGIIALVLLALGDQVVEL